MSGAGKIDADGAAAQFESYFLRRVLAEVPAGDGVTGGGFAGSTFKDMMDEAIADAMSKAGGVGLASSISEQLDPDGAARAPRAAPRAASGQLVSPLDGLHTSSFGQRNDPIEGDRRSHQGLDLGAPEGTVVHAAGGGVVKQAGPAGTYGNLVVLDHGNGLETRYAHLQGVDVKEGTHIEPGTQVGRVGMTGRATGPHLHFEIRRGGQPLDPATEISALKFREARPTH